MDKIYTTQLIGLLKKMNEVHLEELENAARLLSQSIIANGTIYVKGIKELRALEEAVSSGFEPFPNVKIYDQQAPTALDRFLLFSPDGRDQETESILSTCQQEGTPVILIVTEKEYTGSHLVDSFFALGASKGLTPNEKGERVGHPGLFAALYLSNQLYLNIDDILNEIED